MPVQCAVPRSTKSKGNKARPSAEAEDAHLQNSDLLLVSDTLFVVPDGTVHGLVQLLVQLFLR